MLTRRKTTPKEHVEEVLGGDVSLEAAVEVRVAVSVPGRGSASRLRTGRTASSSPGCSAPRTRSRWLQHGQRGSSQLLSPTDSPANCHDLPFSSYNPRVSATHVSATGTWHTSLANPDRRKPQSVKNSLINSNEEVMISLIRIWCMSSEKPFSCRQLCREIKF